MATCKFKHKSFGFWERKILGFIPETYELSAKMGDLFDEFMVFHAGYGMDYYPDHEEAGERLKVKYKDISPLIRSFGKDFEAPEKIKRGLILKVVQELGEEIARLNRLDSDLDKASKDFALAIFEEMALEKGIKRAIPGILYDVKGSYKDFFNIGVEKGMMDSRRSRESQRSI